MDILDKADAVGVFRGLLCQLGLKVEILSDYRVVAGILESIGKDYLTPFSSPNHNDFTEGNCIWLCASDDVGPVMVGAARLEDIGREPIDRYWSRVFKRAYPPVCGERIEGVNSVIVSRVSGRLVYFGDLFVASRARGSRKSLKIFVALGHLLCSLKWEPDWIYCFLRNRDAARGSAFLYGFSWVERKPFVWVGDPPATRSNSECAAFLPDFDLVNVVGALLDELTPSESSESH